MEKIKFIENPWSLESENIFTQLETSPQGLSEKEALRRLDIYSKNIFHKQEKQNTVAIFLKQLTNPLIFILIFAAIVTTLLQEWAEVAVITLAVLVNTGLGFYREYHAENTLEKLSSFIKDRSRVIRSGHEAEIDSEMLVPGDVIKLAYGSRVSADARIINVNNLSTDETILTGESTPVRKLGEVKPVAASTPERANMVHAGTLVFDGFAMAVVGSTTVMMTDKAGSLSEDNMRLVGIYTVDELVAGSTEPASYSKKDQEILEMALANVDVLIENPNSKVSAWTFKGKPFEVNIVKTARDNGLDTSRFGGSGGSQILIPFNSTHKFSVSMLGGIFIIMGAPDVLLARSKMDAQTYNKIESWIIKASDEGRRLIALGKKTSPITSVSGVENIEFIGILAFHDPVRKEVPTAIKSIEALGTRIVMVTGDLKGTAVAVAREIGWTITEQEVLTGRDLQAISDEALLEVMPSIKIFARVTPEDKLRIGLLYRKLGEVVAMTGDGVNDAPSLKAMDIGVALGSGSDVAKSAADLVLLDDNFKTISMAIHEGRRILANIRKTFVYLMSNSLDEVFVIGGSLLVGIALPLSALQIIWVNLFTGSLPALAFAYDEDFDHEMSKKHTLKSIFTREVNILTFGIGVFSSLLLFLMYYLLIRFGVELSLARSVFFVCFASYILVIAFSFRSLHKPLFSYPVFSNKKLNQSVLIAVVLLVATMTLPVFRELFELAPLPPVWLWFIALWLALNVLLVEFAKYLFRTKRS